MKKIIRIVIVGLICFINPNSNLLLAQGYEITHDEGDGWKHVTDQNGTHWYGWEDDNGDWHWDTNPGVPWPPDDIDGDPGDNNELDGDNGEHDDEDDWDDDWDDNHVDQDWDDWWDWWDDFWDLNGDEIDIDHDPTNGNQHACPELMVLTVQPNGADERKRTTVGIGEFFRVYVKNICGGQANWEIVQSGTEGEIVGGDVDFAEFRANFKPGTMTIKASIAGMQQDCATCTSNLEIVVTVIEPNAVTFIENTDNCHERHDYKRPSAGFYSFFYLGPTTVNFYNVSTKERNPDNHNTCTGAYWNGITCPAHTPDITWMAYTTTVNSFVGTASEYPDEAYFPCSCHLDTQNPSGVDAGLAGTLDWKIEYVYARPNPTGVEEVPFKIIHQTGTNFGSLPGQPADMLFRLKKGNEVVSRPLTAPEVCPFYTGSSRCH